MKFFAGTSNIPLATKVAQKLGVSFAEYELAKFDDGEIKPIVKESVRGETAIIFQSTTIHPNDYWMELLLLCDALKRESVAKIIAVIPAFGYARQNQQHKRGEPVSAHVLVRFMENLGVSEVVTIDLHDETMTGMFGIPISNISALPHLAEAVYKYLPKDFAVISPDQGGIERARLFSESLGCKNPIVAVEKKRELGVVHQSHAVQVLGHVKGFSVVIQDDIITSGKTILHSIDALIKQGAKEIFVCVTHQDFSKDTAQRLQQSPIKKMLVTNSVVTRESQMFPKLEIVDISNLLALEIQKIV